MTMPTATFASVAPPADGLALAFTSARRRRNSKAAVSAFGGAVAIASVLSMLAPPGQTLVQEPTQPATGGLVPAVVQHQPLSPRLAELADAPTKAQPAADLSTSISPVLVTTRSHRRAAVAARDDGCSSRRWIACADLHAPAKGPSLRASACESSATVTVEYAPPVKMPIPTSTSRTVVIGTHNCT